MAAPSTAVRPRVAGRLTALAAVAALALALVAPAAGAQTRSRAFYHTTQDVTLAGSVSCDGSGEGTYVVDTEVAVTLHAEGAIDPSGTVEVDAGETVTFTVTGDNTLSLVGDGVETLFDNTGCSGELTITAASGGSSSVNVANRLGERHADRSTVLVRRVRGGRP